MLPSIAIFLGLFRSNLGKLLLANAEGIRKSLDHLNILSVGTIYFPELDGYVRLIHNHSAELARRNHRVTLITQKRKPSADEEVIDGIRVIRVNSPRARGRVSALIRTVALTRGILKNPSSDRSDIVYAFGILPAISAFVTRFSTKAKIVISLGDLTGMSNQSKFSNRMYRLLTMQLLGMADLVVFPSQYAQDILVAKGSHFNNNKMVIIPPGTDLRFFRPEKNAERERNEIILYAGILRRRKGLDVLIKSYKQVCADFPDSKLILVGDGGGRWELENLARNLGVSDRVIFTGRVSEADLKKYHSMASIYALPTRFDTYPTSLVEAMSMGEAVITTRGTATSEIVRQGKNGLLVDSGDEKQLAEALRSLLSRKQLVNELGQNAIRTAREKYSLQSAGDSLEANFRAILREK